MKDIVISLREVWLKYRIEFKEEGGAVVEDFLALKGINLSVARGDTVCLIGENGAGKTSLLKIIAGMLKPDNGSVEITGRVSGLMDIGAGFHKDLTGRENIYLISYLYGLSKNDVDKRCKDITEFASLGRFINAPMKSYSQGMYMRLAFAIAIHMDPDILLIDDTFAVGDIYTQRKCINKIFELRDQGKTIILVTHDMEMARRICARGIFLREGEIIKDGLIDKVCVYYSETVGNKNGIALLQADPLGVVFNNGKLILRWQDSTLTSYLSGHSSMFFAGREYLSTAASWRVHRFRGGREFLALGRWPDISVSQYWKVYLNDGGGFSWEILIRGKREMFPERCETRMIFTDEYRKWFTVASEKEFPANFIHAVQWQCCLIEDPVNTVIGLKGGDNAAGHLPAIIFDRSQDNSQISCYAGNTGSEIRGRIIQYVSFPKKPDLATAFAKHRCFLSTVKIFDQKEQERLQSYLESAARIIERSKAIRSGSFSIFCRENQVEIYWQDKLLTKGAGLNTQFRYQGKDYRAIDGNWAIGKDSEEELVITISWDDGAPFKQIWRLKLQDKETIAWEIAMETAQELRIKNKQTEMLLSEGYEQWLAAEEKGDFKRLDKNGTVTLNRYANVFIGLEGSDKMRGAILPGIVFSYTDKAPRASYIFKNKAEGQVTKLQYVEIDYQENSCISPERCGYFKGLISAFNVPGGGSLIKTIESKHPVLAKEERPSNRIELKRLALIFDYGKGRILWNGSELTKGFGLYSSVLLKDRWQDSPQAFWEIQRLDKTSLIAIGRWPWVPLVQTWEVTIADENMIIWKVRQEIWEEVILEKEQMNLMTSDTYREWFSHEQARGEFPEKFSEYNGLSWDRLWRGDMRQPIGLKKSWVKDGIFSRKPLPALVFECDAYCRARYAIVENTDHIFKARVLQYELDSSRTIKEDNKEDKCFEGRIRILDKK